jgi:ketosteroid isomerase-like protein
LSIGFKAASELSSCVKTIVLKQISGQVSEMKKKLFRCLSVLLSFVLLSFLVLAQKDKQQSDLMSLVEAERAFARASVAKGIRDSFLEFFADDGVNFSPEPGNAKEFYGKRPAGPSLITLDWSPIYADISQAGDMGYTTGPYTVTSKEQQKVVGQGYYFSVWKKQAGGNWKVAADIGIQTPAFESKEFPKFQASQQFKRSKTDKVNLEAEREQLMKSDRSFNRPLAKVSY